MTLGLSVATQRPGVTRAVSGPLARRTDPSGCQANAGWCTSICVRTGELSTVARVELAGGVDRDLLGGLFACGPDRLLGPQSQAHARTVAPPAGTDPSSRNLPFARATSEKGLRYQPLAQGHFGTSAHKAGRQHLKTRFPSSCQSSFCPGSLFANFQNFNAVCHCLSTAGELAETKVSPKSQKHSAGRTINVRVFPQMTQLGLFFVKSTSSPPANPPNTKPGHKWPGCLD